jgi:hypothetical protein
VPDARTAAGWQLTFNRPAAVHAQEAAVLRVASVENLLVMDAAAERVRAEWEAAQRMRWDTAMSVLKMVLTATQREQMASEDHFDLTSSTGRWWRIHTNGHTGNVDLLNDHGRAETVYCAHPPAGVDPAAWLTQARTLIRDEGAFLAVAVPQLHYNYDDEQPSPPPPVAAPARRPLWRLAAAPRRYDAPRLPQPPCYTLTAGTVHLRPACRCC